MRSPTDVLPGSVAAARLAVSRLTQAAAFAGHGYGNRLVGFVYGLVAAFWSGDFFFEFEFIVCSLSHWTYYESGTCAGLMIIVGSE